MKITGNQDFLMHQNTNIKVERLAALPTFSSDQKGRFFIVDTGVTDEKGFFFGGESSFIRITDLTHIPQETIVALRNAGLLESDTVAKVSDIPDPQLSVDEEEAIHRANFGPTDTVAKVSDTPDPQLSVDEEEAIHRANFGPTDTAAKVIDLGDYAELSSENTFSEEQIFKNGVYCGVSVSVPDTYTKSLLHFEGADESTEIIDDISDNTWVVSGSYIKIDTAEKKFNSSSIRVSPGGSSCIYCNKPAFTIGTDPFTIDFWYYTSGFHNIPMRVWLGSASDFRLNIYLNYINLVHNDITRLSFSSTKSQWHHVAIVGNSTDIKVYYDGILQGTYISAYNFTYTYYNLGVQENSKTVYCWFDEVRLSIGLARWTENFTPPSNPYTTYNEGIVTLHSPDAATEVKLTYTNLADLLDNPLTSDEKTVIKNTGLSLTDTLVVEDDLNNYLKLDQTTPQGVINGKPTFEGIQLNPTPTVGDRSVGKLYFDETWSTPSCDVTDSVTLQIGQEQLKLVYNDTGSVIPDGKAVYATGVHNNGGKDVETVALAKADSESTSIVIGLTTESIDINSYGMVCLQGNINNLDTDIVGWSAGDNLYLSADTAGELTNVAPDAPNLNVLVGRLLTKSSTTGKIYIKTVQNYNLNDLINVFVPSPNVDDVLRFNGLSWVNGSSCSVSSSSGIEFFPDTTNIISLSSENEFALKTLNKYPINTSEIVLSIICSTNTVAGCAFLYDTVLNRTLLDSGNWSFLIYASVNSVGGGRISSIQENIYKVSDYSTINITITGTGTSRTCTANSGTPFATDKIDTSVVNTDASYVQTPKGIYQISSRTSDTEVTIIVPAGYSNETTVIFSVWKKLFGIETNTITNLTTNYGAYNTSSAQESFALDVTDKIGTIIFGTSNNDTTIYYTYNGTTHYSYFKTPIATVHNELLGLQGGLSDEMYHLSEAEYTAIYNSSLLITDTLQKTGEAPTAHASSHTVTGGDPVSANSWHGIVSRPVGETNPLPTHITTNTFMIGGLANPISYYYKGTLVTVSTDISCTLDSGAGLYFIYFNQALGTISASTSFPGIDYNSDVLIAICNWNGSDYGLVLDERHGYTRCKKWHIWAHNTVGVQYVSGITLTASGTGAAATFSATLGEIADEDIQFVINATTNARHFYLSGASTYSFDNALSTVPFKMGVNNRPVMVKASDYTLTELTSAPNRYINVFVYATSDLLSPLYFFVDSVSDTVYSNNGYSTLSDARTQKFPNLAGMGIGPELKPIYRLIIRADGVVQTINTSLDDYRTVSSLPQSAGLVPSTASSVSVNPFDDITSTNVQTALEEINTKIDAVPPVTDQVTEGAISLENMKCSSYVWTSTTDANYLNNIRYYASEAADSLEFYTEIYFGIGVYELISVCTHYNNLGKITVYLDDVYQGEFDTYNANVFYNIKNSVFLNVTTDDIHTLKFVTSKNGSSSGYYVYFSKMEWKKIIPGWIFSWAHGRYNNHKFMTMTVVAGGALTRGTNASIKPFGEWFYQAGAAQNDELESPDLTLPIGTYSVKCWTNKNDYIGIVSLYEGANLIDTEDLYASPAVLNYTFTKNFSLSSITSTNIKTKMETKNASSSGYGFDVQCWELERLT